MESTEKMTIIDDDTPIMSVSNGNQEQFIEEEPIHDEEPVVFDDEDHDNVHEHELIHHETPIHFNEPPRVRQQDDSSWVYATLAIVALFLFFVMQRR
jgi:hypothetical protein